MIHKILSYPLLFNYIRWIGTGNQPNTKEFVRKNLEKYKVKSVLDVGCGTGDFVKAIPLGVDYLGVDINERFIKYAIKENQKSKIKDQKQNNCVSCHSVLDTESKEIPESRSGQALNQVQDDRCAITLFKTGDVLDEEFYKNKKFDAVLLISMLHHFSDKELEIMLPLIKKTTKKVVIIADIIPDPGNIIGRLLVKVDQGKFIRENEKKIKIISKYFKITKTELINSGFVKQFGIVCVIS